MSTLMEQMLIKCSSQGTPGTGQRSDYQGRRQVKCYGCGRYGHILANCRFQASSEGAGAIDKPSKRQGPSGGEESKTEVKVDPPKAQLNSNPPRL